MWLRLYKWLRYIVVTILVFNAFQGMMLTTRPRGVSKLRSIRAEDGSTTEKIVFNSQKEPGSDVMIKRYGLLTTRPNSNGTIIICHGFTFKKEDITLLRTFFSDYNCLLFDFRAHGENKENQECTFGKNEAYDVIGAANFIKNHPLLKDKKLFGYGLSMGAVSLIEAQSQKNMFNALILDGAFDSSETIIDRGLERFKIEFYGYNFDIPGKSFLKKLTFNSYTQTIAKYIFKLRGMDITAVNSRFDINLRPEDSIQKINTPCLFIHCKNDSKIPVYSAKNIFNRANGFKKLWLTNGRDHCDSFLFNPEQYKQITNNFLNKSLLGELNNKDSEIIEDKE